MNLLPHLLGATNFTGYKPHQVDGDLRWIQAEKFDSIFFLPRACNQRLISAHLDVQLVTADCTLNHPDYAVLHHLVDGSFQRTEPQDYQLILDSCLNARKRFIHAV